MLPLSGLCPPNKGYSEFISKAEEQYFDKYDQAVKQQAPLMEAEELPQAFNVKVMDDITEPEHYKVLDTEAKYIIHKALSESEWRGYCLGNVMKYRLRAGKKDAIEKDIGKANEYEAIYKNQI